MDQARHGAVAVFAQRVVGLAQAVVELGGGRDHGPPQRLVLVVAGDQAHVVGRDADRQHGAGLRQGRPLLVRKHQHLFQLGQGSQAISGLPMPIVPVAIGDVGIESLAEGPGLEGAARGPARRGRRGRRYLARRLHAAASAGRIALQREGTGIGPSYSEALHHLHTSTNTPQHQCWPFRNILLGSGGESGARHPYRPLDNDRPGRANSVIGPGRFSSFLIPFGNTIRNLKVIHTVPRKIVKRKSCRWTRKVAIRDADLSMLDKMRGAQRATRSHPSPIPRRCRRREALCASA